MELFERKGILSESKFYVSFGLEFVCWKEAYVGDILCLTLASSAFYRRRLTEQNLKLKKYTDEIKSSEEQYRLASREFRPLFSGFV
jgi:hypothetical protein